MSDHLVSKMRVLPAMDQLILWQRLGAVAVV
jgi:hypothetical protein